MRKHLEVARAVKGSVVDAERDLDAAMASIATLTSTVLRSRLEVGVSFFSPSVSGVVATLAAMVETRRELSVAHEALAQTARTDLRLPEVGFGGFEECPNLTAPSGEERRVIGLPTAAAA